MIWLSLSCISDDAQGEQLDVLWDGEIGTRVLDEELRLGIAPGMKGEPEAADDEEASEQESAD